MSNLQIQSTNNKQKKIAGGYLPAIISFVILVLIDQLTKYYIDYTMDLYDSIPVWKNVFEIFYIHNPGAAWGIFENMQWLFYITTIIVIFFGVLFFIRCKNERCFKWMEITIILILSGAVGNFIDRIRFQYVLDFLYFKLIDFPVFNIADCYVTIGFILLIILILFVYKEEDLEKLTHKKGI